MADDDGSGSVITVTDDYLQTVVAPQLENFIQELNDDVRLASISTYAEFTPGGAGTDAGTSQYDALMPGNTVWAPASDLQAKFTKLCSDIMTGVNTLSSQMSQLAVDLKMAQATLQNGAQDALTAGQMVQILQPVYEITSSTTSSSGSGGGSTGGANSNVNSNSNANSN